MALPIEDYALIGDRRTAALVGTNGSMDWLCLPRFDSAACLAALLGTEDHGHWQLVPDGELPTERRYVGASAVLETTFTTSDGVVTLTDLMPRGDDRADVVRTVRGVRGRVRMRHEWRVRLDYGLVRPWVRRKTVAGEQVITAVGGPDQLVLRGPRLPGAGEAPTTTSSTSPRATTWCSRSRGSRRRRARRLRLPEDRIEASGEDEGWATLRVDVPHADVVRRSLLTLRLMTDELTGGIVAAPTTSLPRTSVASATGTTGTAGSGTPRSPSSSLIAAGYTEEAELWRGWLLRAIAGDPAKDCRSCTPSTGPAGCPSSRSGTCRATRTRVRCGSATARSSGPARRARRGDGSPSRTCGTPRAKPTSTPGPSSARWSGTWPAMGEPDNGLWEIRGEPRRSPTLA